MTKLERQKVKIINIHLVLCVYSFNKDDNIHNGKATQLILNKSSDIVLLISFAFISTKKGNYFKIASRVSLFEELRNS